MGDIIPFSGALQEETRASRRLKEGNWRMVNLRGGRPKGHPVVQYTRLGKVILAPRQVWVELHTDELWQLFGLYPNQNPEPRHHRVVLKRYRRRGDRFTYPTSENSLRLNMRVWDEACRERIGTIDNLVASARADGHAANKVGVQNFFGLDRFGNRID